MVTDKTSKTSVFSFQADEPIADYAAMDDVYQGEWFLSVSVIQLPLKLKQAK